MATVPSCQLQSWHTLPPPPVWAATAMTPSHCAFVRPVLQLLRIPTPIEWEGFHPFYGPSQQTNRPEDKTSSHHADVQTTANGDSLLGFDIAQRGCS